jgi:NAD(P)-dependent dehydrogenase (short-subunit alcohol dehydrogenase family)
MNQENKNNKVLITGHTRGIGRAVFDLLTQHGYECAGFSQSTGHNILECEDMIVDKVEQFDYVVLNAYAQHSQEIMLKKIVERYSDKDLRVAVITSTSGTSAGADDDIIDEEYTEYKQLKKDLIRCISEVQQDLVDKKLNVYDVCPDTVYTDMTVGLWEQYPKLQPKDVAECVHLVFSNKGYNINKIVIQKNAD